MQFFRCFIKNFSETAASPTNLTKKGNGLKDWDVKCDGAFKELKEKLIQAQILVSPDWSRPFRCRTDACQFADGGSLTQYDGAGNERVVSYFLKRRSPAEENYSANDRELLGLVYILKRFRCYVEGSLFEVLTDSQVLKNFFNKATLSRHEAGWLECLDQFGISGIALVKGKVHVLGDVPSKALTS